MILQGPEADFSAEDPMEFIRVFRAVSLDTAGCESYNLVSDTHL